MSSQSPSLIPPSASSLQGALRQAMRVDKARLLALASYAIVGTPPEQVYDDLAQLAAQICHASAAFVTFVDGDQQFFKASTGADGSREAAMESGFCPLTVAHGSPLVIPDTLADTRYAKNPAVQGESPVRFYAGVPVRSPEGHVLGTICVIDFQPRTLSDSNLDALQALGRQVETLLTLRQMNREQAGLIAQRDASAAARDIADAAHERGQMRLRESEQKFRALADNIAQLAWMADAAGYIFWYNQRWFDYTGTTLEEMQGWGWQKVHHADFVEPVTAKFQDHLLTGEPWEDTFPLLGKDGVYRWFLSRAIPTFDDLGHVEFWCGTNTDVTDWRQAQEALRLSEAAVLEREQRVRSLYQLTSRADLGFDEKVDALLHAVREWLHLDVGVLARTDCHVGTYEIIRSDADATPPPVGFTCPLSTTYCADTVERGPNSPPLAIEHAGASDEWRTHPAYKSFGGESYLATAIWVNDAIWGTISFVSKTPREHPFTDFDKDIVRLMAQWIDGQIARQESEAARRATAIQQRRFVREMLASVTEGKLCLCDSPDDLPDPLDPVTGPLTLTPPTLRTLRKQVEAVSADLHLPTDRTQDLLTAVGEAGMNAIKHGGGGTARIHADPIKRIVQVWIADQGKGIREEDLHRATLEKGWSGAGSLGHGFFLMLRTVDRTYLLTGAQGTTVVLEQESATPEPAWLKAVAPPAY